MSTEPNSDPVLAQKYDRAITLINFYVQMSWLVFGAFLLSETVILTAAGAAVAVAQRGPAILVSLLGLVLIVPWWSAFKYNHALYLLRMIEARECEPEAGDFFTRGHELIQGGTFRSPQHTTLKQFSAAIPAYARWLTPSKSITLLILFFALAFLGLLVQSFQLPQSGSSQTFQPATPTLTAPTISTNK
jgi:hypothetical protein